MNNTPNHPHVRYLGDFIHFPFGDQITFPTRHGTPYTITVWHPIRTVEDLRQQWGEEFYDLLPALSKALIENYSEKRSTDGHRTTLMRARARSARVVLEEMLESGFTFTLDGSAYAANSNRNCAIL